jgi:hypothetical protein
VLAVELLRAGRSADSMLNHILKNSIAGAACLLELDQQGMLEKGDNMSTRLEQALNQLYKTMQWCSLRQVCATALEKKTPLSLIQFALCTGDG